MTDQMSEATKEKLVLLIEECGEVIQAATKILRFGLYSTYNSGETNVNALEREIGDVQAAVEQLTSANTLNPLSIHRYCIEKRDYLKQLTEGE